MSLDSPEGSLALTAPAQTRPLSQTTSGFGMIVFLASDLMIFAAFFSAYFLLRSVNSEWPSPHAELNTLRAGFATVALAVSSITMIAADRAHRAASLVSYRRWVGLTMALGAGFLINQFIEYRALQFQASTDAYGSIYWMLTGLHSVHVAVGLMALALLLVRAQRASDLEAFAPWNTAISAFWHVVDVVWIAVFLTIWVIR